MHIKNKIVNLVLKWGGFKSISFNFNDFNEYSDTLIRSTLKKNGFIELNKKGEFYLRDFTLIEIISKTIEDKKGKEIKVISGVSIKHDIDSIMYKPSKGIVLAGKFTSLQLMIDYFSKI